MIRHQTIAGLIVLATIFISRVEAEPPQYQPYGAWRGRIRYVDRQAGVRTHIRWGNGITPVGGQVLTTLITEASNVARDPNALANVANLIGKGAEEIDQKLLADIERIQSTNEELAEELNKLRAELDRPLPQIKLTTDANLEDGEASQASLSKFIAEIRQDRRDLKKLLLEAIAMRSNPTIADSNAELLATLDSLSKLDVVDKSDSDESDPKVVLVPIVMPNQAKLNSHVEKIRKAMTGLDKKLSQAIKVGEKLEARQEPGDASKFATTLGVKFKTQVTEGIAKLPTVNP